MPKITAPAGRCMRSRSTSYTSREEDNALIIEGYMVVFDQPYYIDDYCEEVVARGAFDSCDCSDVRALIDHLPHLVLGRSTVNTCSWSIDDYGIFVTIRINAKDTDAMNLYARCQRGDVDQASFGFWEFPDGVDYEDLPDGRVRRVIRRIKKLDEFSVCTFPAYEQTLVQARGIASAETVRADILRAKKEKLKRRFRHHA